MMKIRLTDSTIPSDAMEGSTIELRVKRRPDETHPSTASPGGDLTPGSGRC
jgi:hypothetical protein